MLSVAVDALVDVVSVKVDVKLPRGPDGNTNMHTFLCENLAIGSDWVWLSPCSLASSVLSPLNQLVGELIRRQILGAHS